MVELPETQQGELRQRLQKAMNELYESKGETVPEWEPSNENLRHAVEALENNLAVLRWLKKARLVGAMGRVLRRRREALRSEVAALEAAN